MYLRNWPSPSSEQKIEMNGEKLLPDTGMKKWGLGNDVLGSLVFWK
jgi:hypothetical protein